MPLSVGTRLGPYEVRSILGAGGMGEVYRARDTRLNRDVAVKVLPAGFANDADRRARFDREAKAVAALSHPNILSIFDFAVADGIAYVVTELLEGETLRSRLSQGPLAVRRATDIAIQLARGLTAAHDKGLVHRDLKPENIFLLKDGQVKVLDFGLAKSQADEARSGDGETGVATDPGTVLGTVAYMSPEQVRGEAVDARTDIFAFGAVLYEMLSGRQAFHKETAAETMTSILKEDAPELTQIRTDLPLALDAVVRHCLERNPAERFQSARDLAFSLQAVGHSTSSASVASGPTVTSARSRRERFAWLIAAVSVALAAVIGLTSRGSQAAAASPIVRFQVAAADKTSFATSIGAPEGSNGGTISPDGSTLAFAAGDASGKILLWVRRLDSAVARPLPSTEGAAFPFWSPDSRFLGFFTTNRLKKVAVEGGPAQTLCELAATPRGGSWNTRGEVIFATAGSPVFRVSADGGEPTPVLNPDAQTVNCQWPWFLPDDDHFLYYGAAARAIFLGSLASGAIKRITASDTNAVFVAPRYLFFVREGSLLVQDFDLTRFDATGEARPVVEQISWALTPWNLGAFSVSTNGTLSYRGGGGSQTQLTWFDRSGRPVGAVGPPGDYLSPALSPDETKVAFTRRDDQPSGDIWILDLVRQTRSRVTTSPSSDIFPVWSNDGASIIYESIQDGFVATSVTGVGAPTRILSPTSAPKGSAYGMLIPSQVLPDNRLLFFGDFLGKTAFDIYFLALSGDGKPVPIVHTPFSDAEPQVSPDGKWIAYASTETGDYDVFVEPFPSTGAKIPISNGGGRQPMWSADGRELFFVTKDRKLFVAEVKPGTGSPFGEPRFLFDMPANVLSVRNSYLASRDGKRFLVNRLLDTTVPPINVVLNWVQAGMPRNR